MESHELAIVGAGPAGYSAALHASRLGIDVALIEKDVLGGECLNYACIPFKAVLHYIKLVHKFKEAISSGVCKGDLNIDLDGLRRYREGIVRGLRDHLTRLLERNGVRIIEGEAYKVRYNTLYVKQGRGGMVAEVRFNNLLLALGSIPMKIHNIEPDGESILTSRDAIKLNNIPEKLAIIGGGPVGIEVATLYKSLGSDVSIFEMMDQIIPGIDRDISTRLEYSLRKMGIKIYKSSRVKGVKQAGDKIKLYTEDGVWREFGSLILAVGRIPYTMNTLVSSLDISLDERGFIKVDHRQATNVKNVYAAGDVTGPPMLAHKAYWEGLNTVESIYRGHYLEKPRYIPITIYSYPEVFSIGLSEYSSRDLKAIKIPLSTSGKAYSEGVKGLIKVVYRECDKEIVGIHIVGDIASSLSELSTIITQTGLKAIDIASCIFPHPTYGEAIWEATAYICGLSIHYG